MRDKQEVNNMPKKKDPKGLCSSCRSGSTCTYTKDCQYPVLQCEEFDGYAPAPVRAKVKKTAAALEEKDTGKYKGLCVNCEDRKTCRFPKPEGGVWHCEEYR